MDTLIKFLSDFASIFIIPESSVYLTELLKILLKSSSILSLSAEMKISFEEYLGS